EEILAEAEAWTEEEIREAIDEAREKPSDGAEVETENPDDPLAGISEGQVRGLPVPVRIRLARNSTRQMRNLLIRDSSAQVALAVINGNSLPDSEVEQIANNRAVLADVLEAINKKREWIRKYSIAKALAKNPRTPAMISVRLVPRLVMRDLRELARDKNVPDAVRSTALRLYQAKR
ncbi:MAG: hypothetical protein AAGD38_15460, partial [Acidobacteriota bacterium]